jgi:hypothetical protein
VKFDAESKKAENSDMVLAQKLQTAVAVWSFGEISPARVIGGGSATVAELGLNLHGVGTSALIA